MTDEVAHLVIEQLKLLRGDVQGLKSEQRATNERLDETNQRLDGVIRTTNERFERVEERLDRVVEGQIRMATALTAEIRHLGDRIDNVFLGPLGSTVRDHEERIQRLEKRVDEG